MALPEHEYRNAEIDNNRDVADYCVHVARALESLNQLCATFGASDCSKGHDESQFEINIAQRAVLLCRYNRLADDVRQVRANRVIPIHSHQAQRRAGDETSADAKKSTQDANDKADNHEIDRVDVRVGDWKKHELFPAASEEAKQKSRHRVQDNGLAGDEQNGDAGISIAMLRFEPIQPVPQEIKNQEEIANDQNRIDRQFSGENPETFSSLFFHQAKMARALNR